MVTITFRTSNAAFENDELKASADILRGIISRIENGKRDGVIMDTNGNKIGQWWFD